MTTQETLANLIYLPSFWPAYWDLAEQVAILALVVTIPLVIWICWGGGSSLQFAVKFVVVCTLTTTILLPLPIYYKLTLNRERAIRQIGKVIAREADILEIQNVGNQVYITTVKNETLFGVKTQNDKQKFNINGAQATNIQKELFEPNGLAFGHNPGESMGPSPK